MLSVIHASASNGLAETMAVIGILFWIVLSLGFYFLPTIIAFVRKRPNAVPILLLNFFLGWTLVGWVVSLVWAASSDRPAQQIIVNTTVAAPPTPPTAPALYPSQSQISAPPANSDISPSGKPPIS